MGVKANAFWGIGVTVRGSKKSLKNLLEAVRFEFTNHPSGHRSTFH
jgi:hypothetical protein